MGVLNMKKIIIPIFLALLSITAVSALVLPCPIAGTITATGGWNIGSLTVIGKNLNTGEEMHASMGGSNYMLEVANFPKSYRNGDTIRVSIVECAPDPLCVKEVQVYGAPIELNFDLTGLKCPPCDCPTCPTCDSCCPVPVECDSCCPTIESCEDQGYILPEDCDVTNCEDAGYILPEDCKDVICPECINPIVIIVIVIVFLIIGIIIGKVMK